MTPGQREFMEKTLGVIGWLFLGLYALGIVGGFIAGESEAATAAVFVAFYFSPALLVGIVLLWARRFLSLGDSRRTSSS